MMSEGESTPDTFFSSPPAGHTMAEVDAAQRRVENRITVMHGRAPGWSQETHDVSFHSIETRRMSVVRSACSRS